MRIVLYCDLLHGMPQPVEKLSVARQFEELTRVLVWLRT